MLKLYPEQFHTQFNKRLYAAYLLLGNDPLLLQESHDFVRQIATTQGFYEHHTVQIDNNTDWQKIFSLCKERSLFATQQTLTLFLPETGPNTEVNKQLGILVKLLHSSVLLVVRGNKLTKTQENATWFIKLAAANAVLVMCQTPDHIQLPKWVATRACQYNLRINESACRLLCYYYEGNLLALTQILNQCLLLWPDGEITLDRLKKLINDVAHFTPFHLVEALFTGNSKRALHILQQLRLEGNEPIILLRIIQRELLLLINIKRQSKMISLHILFDQFHVWQNRRAIITKAVDRLSYHKLRQAVNILTHIELALKQDYTHSVWNKLENLSCLLCSREISDIFIDS